jgi:hypothetical protein
MDAGRRWDGRPVFYRQVDGVGLGVGMLGWEALGMTPRSWVATRAVSEAVSFALRVLGPARISSIPLPFKAYATS